MANIDPDVDKELHNVTESLPLVVLITTQTQQKNCQLQEPSQSKYLLHDITEDIIERLWKVPDIWDHCHIHKAYLVDVQSHILLLFPSFFLHFFLKFFNLYIVQKISRLNQAGEKIVRYYMKF